jgi:hypothetical protein
VDIRPDRNDFFLIMKGYTAVWADHSHLSTVLLTVANNQTARFVESGKRSLPHDLVTMAPTA